MYVTPVKNSGTWKSLTALEIRKINLFFILGANLALLVLDLDPGEPYIPYSCWLGSETMMAGHCITKL